MQIHSTLTNRAGQVLPVTYTDVTNEADLAYKKINAVHAYCFYADKLVLVYAEQKGYWTPPGGGVEEGESIEAAVIREVLEESNMKVIAQRLIGCQDIEEPQGTVSQTRSVCIVEPHGPFELDPDGDITKIALVNPDQVHEYFSWGEIGDHILTRALELKQEMIPRSM